MTGYSSVSISLLKPAREWADGECSWTDPDDDVGLAFTRAFILVQSPGKKVLCIDGGPADLTAAYLLSRQGYPVTVFEADPRHLGGLARTVSHGSYLSDIGPHRFFSKSTAVTRLWHEILGEDFIRCLCKTRIYYRGKFFDYP